MYLAISRRQNVIHARLNGEDQNCGLLTAHCVQEPYVHYPIYSSHLTAACKYDVSRSGKVKEPRYGLSVKLRFENRSVWTPRLPSFFYSALLSQRESGV